MNIDLSKTENFEEKLKMWLQEVATKCHDYALKNDVDFYVFQSALPQKPNPDLLIIGINPGGYVSYNGAMHKLKMEKRTAQHLAAGINMYTTKNVNNEKMRRVMLGNDVDKNFTDDCIFHNQYLFDLLDNATIMNMFYFNTKKEGDITKMCQENELQYCKDKTLEFIEMLNPTNILFFTTSEKNLYPMGVEKIKSIGSYVKEGKLKGRTVYAMPHPSGWRGWNMGENRKKQAGEKLEEILQTT